MNWLIKNFFRGLVIVVPIAFTLWVIVSAFESVDRLLGFKAPGIGVAVLVASTILIGALASSYLMRKLLRLTDTVFTRAPLVRIIYTSIKDLLEAFVGDKKRFDRPVAVSLGNDVMTLGFLTADDLAFLALPNRVAVYLPFAYSMTGSVVVVPSARITPLAVDSASVMALIVSGGVSRVG